jgi:hypothetical protein
MRNRLSMPLYRDPGGGPTLAEQIVWGLIQVTTYCLDRYPDRYYDGEQPPSPDALPRFRASGLAQLAHCKAADVRRELAEWPAVALVVRWPGSRYSLSATGLSTAMRELRRHGFRELKEVMRAPPPRIRARRSGPRPSAN